MKYVIGGLLVFNVFLNYGQQKILRNKADSLKQLIDASAGIEKVNHLNTMAFFQLDYSYDKSQDYASKGLDLAKKLNIKEGVARSYQIIGTSHWISANYKSAASNLSKAIQLYNELGDSSRLAESLNTYGLQFYYQAMYNDAIREVGKALNIFMLLKDSFNISRISNNLGLIYQVKGDFENANQLIAQGLRHKLRYSNILDQHNSSTRNQILYKDNTILNQLVTEKRNLLLSDEIYELAKGYSQVGKLFQIAGNHDSAIWYFEKAAVIFDSLGEKKKECLEIIDIGNSYLELGKTAKAKTLFHKAISCTTNEKMYASRDGLRTKLGQIALSENNPQIAIDNFTFGLELSKSVNHEARMAFYLSSLSEAYLKSGNTELAISTARKAYETAEEIGSFVQLKNAAKKLFDANKAKGRLTEALKYQQEFYELDREQENALTEKASLEYQAQLDLFQKTGEIELLTKERSKSEVLLKARTRILIVSLVSFLLIVGLSVVIYTRLRKNSRLMKEVSERNTLLFQRNAEKEVLLKEIHHRVKNNLQVVSSMLSMQKRRSSVDQANEMLDLTQNRVQAIGLIHEHLYKSHDVSRVSLHYYIPHLVDLLRDTGISQYKPQIQMDIDQRLIDLDTAVSIGLIINELVTNSLKHAFDSQKNPEIQIIIQHRNDQLLLSVEDNGSGSSSFKDGFGFSLVRSITSSLAGKIKFKTDNGFYVEIIICDFKLV